MRKEKESKLNSLVITEFTFKKLFSDYYIRLCDYAESFVSDSSIAEDIVQDIFFKLWDKKDDMYIDVSINAYLYRAVHNASIHYLRHKKVSQKHAEYHKIKLQEAELLYYSTLDTTSKDIQSDELEKLTRDAINSFPDKTKEVFLFSREENLKNQEIADRLNLSLKTVEYHISKALVGLKKALKDYL
jgi:RNA polymerase sigma-70 factor (ECF subfamily)